MGVAKSFLSLEVLVFRFRVHSSLAADAVRSPRFAYATEFPQFSRDIPTERFGSSFPPRRIMPSKILPSQKSSRRRLNTGSAFSSRQEATPGSAEVGPSLSQLASVATLKVLKYPVP